MTPRVLSPLEQQSALCITAIQAAETRWGTPPGLLLAIAKTESGRPIPPRPGLQPWPWAIDADGAAEYQDSKASAVAWVRGALSRGARAVDVGCMQVNLQAHPNAFRGLEDAFDPGSNADYAARYLAALHAETGGNWFVATGYYHSHTPDLASAYRDRVTAIAAGREPPVNAFQPLYLRAIQQGTLRLALAGGGMLRINLNRQPTAPGHRRMGRCQVAAVLAPLLSSPPRACGPPRTG